MQGSTYAYDPGVVVLVDNSNLWIEGKRAYARTQGLHANEDPRWRVNLGKMVEMICGDRPLSKIYIFGSTPPPVDDVWQAFERQKGVVYLSERSHWTGAEKEVDMKFGLTLLKDVMSLRTECSSEAERERRDEARRSRSYVLITGDIDYASACDCALEQGFPVEVWSWHNALSKKYHTLAAKYTLLTIHTLDERIDEYGFTRDNWDISRHRIPPERTIVVLRAREVAPYMPALFAALAVPYYTYRLQSAAQRARGGDDDADVAIILHYASTDNCVSFLNDVRSLLRDAGSSDSVVVEKKGKGKGKGKGKAADTRVISYIEWSQKNFNIDNKKETVHLSEMYEVLREEEEEENDNEDEDTDDDDNDANVNTPSSSSSSSGGEGKMSGGGGISGSKSTGSSSSSSSSNGSNGSNGNGNNSREKGEHDWEVVSAREAKTSRKKAAHGRTRCYAWEFCSNGLKCKFGHTREEATLFSQHGGRSPYSLRKVSLCTREDRCQYNTLPEKCRFAHGRNDLFCTVCAAFVQHNVFACPNALPGTDWQRKTLSPAEYDGVRRAHKLY